MLLLPLYIIMRKLGLVDTLIDDEEMPKSKKLVRIMVDLGEDELRQIVAGIAERYAAADLVGRQIVVVANLKPAKLMGVESRGMLLAATADGAPHLLFPDGDVPHQLNATYYAQRASAGLIIAEATQVSPQGKGYAFTPGIHSDEQVEGWRKVTSAVHDQGGRIVLQLWHVGRISHHSLQPEQGLPEGPTDGRPEDAVCFAYDENGNPGYVPTSPPQALDMDGILRIREQFVQAANNAYPMELRSERRRPNCQDCNNRRHSPFIKTYWRYKHTRFKPHNNGWKRNAPRRSI